MKSINGYDASGLLFAADATSRQTVSSAITAPEESISVRSSKTPLHSSTTCEQSVTLTKHSNRNSKLTGSTMTKDMNAATCNGRPEQDKTITSLPHSMWSSTGGNSALQTLFSSIPRFLEAGLTRCIKRVNHWTRSLECKAAAREARGIPVYDIIEAGQRHRFKTISHTVSNCVLGLGYGMGAAKFVDSCKSQGLDLPSLPVSEWPEIDRRLLFIIRNIARIKGDPYSQANQIAVGRLIKSIQTVNEWRNANQKIVDRWKYYESVFKQRVAAGKDTVAFRLPSGRIKRYWNPHLAKEETIEVDENGTEHPSFRVAMKATLVRGEAPKFLTGGSIMENIVQASCRDIMTYGAVEIEEKHPSWKFKFSVYDEVVFEVPDEECDEAAKEIPLIMTKGDRIAEWTNGMPLEVEGAIVERYCK